jgi:hypothetical protein
MKSIALAVLMLILTSCSTVPFNEALHCSPRALEYKKHDLTSPKIVNKDSSEKIERNEKTLIEIMSGAKEEITQCYRNIKKLRFLDNYQICVVLGIENKKLTFLDIDDHAAKLDQELHECIEKYFKNSDFSKIDSPNRVTVSQPIYTH